MKRLTLLFICLQLSVSAAASANPTFVGRLSALKDIDDFLTDIKEQEKEAQEADDTAELDEQGEQTYAELKAWAEQNPEEFAKMVASEDGLYDEVDENSADPMADAGSYCADPNDSAFTWEAKGKKRGKRRGKGKGARCTAAALKTNISTCCLLFVRTKLGLPANPRSQHAKDYGSVLLSHGYCALKTTPRAAPVGAVLIYNGGASGHIERKLASNRYWWGPSNSGPATEWKSKKRTLKGAYAKCRGGKGKGKT